LIVERLGLSVCIPTYRREAVLLRTLDYLLALRPAAAEILVLDQTPSHEPATEARLQALADQGSIRWLRLPEPSVTAAMNVGLASAREEVVLFVDDDVRPESELLHAHVQAHATHPDGLVAGRVIQPWEEDCEPPASGFASRQTGTVPDFIGCNFSIRRSLALALGGFDENFVRVAYRYEAEFSHRYRAQGRRILFEPRACLHHLKEQAGGTRSYGQHLTTWRPDHAVGAYYYSLRTGTWREFLTRPVRAIATRHHLRHPWHIPATLCAELAGMAWALVLHLQGPRLLSAPAAATP
jgi:GT2 family glycosyltransferase